MDEEPIYDFHNLRAFLIRHGYMVKQAQGYRPITPKVIDPSEIRRGSMEFRDDGIFVIHPETGEEQQVFLYKQDYRLEEYGKPRFHICKCKIIQEFISSGGFREHYVRANSDPVPVKNMNNYRREEIVSELPLCRYCRDQVMEFGNITSKKFVELLKEARGVEEEQEVKEVDIFGYTRDWDDISREYREKHDYTCERCGLKITDAYYRQYIHCHHKDKNKLNNKESNLECLCMRCHSQVDEYHNKNLTTGANGIMMQEFNKKYPPKDDNESLIDSNESPLDLIRRLTKRDEGKKKEDDDGELV